MENNRSNLGEMRAFLTTALERLKALETSVAELSAEVRSGLSASEQRHEMLCREQSRDTEKRMAELIDLKIAPLADRIKEQGRIINGLIAYVLLTLMSCIGWLLSKYVFKVG